MLMRHTEIGGNALEAFVECPKHVAGEDGSCQQLDIIPPDTASVEIMNFQKFQTFIRCARGGSRNSTQRRERLRPLREIPARQFPDHDGMNRNAAVPQCLGE